MILFSLVNRNKYNNISTQPKFYNLYIHPSPQVRIARRRITSLLTDDGSSGPNDNTAVVFPFSVRQIRSEYLHRYIL